jgi:hypothetical protein
MGMKRLWNAWRTVRCLATFAKRPLIDLGFGLAFLIGLAPLSYWLQTIFP